MLAINPAYGEVYRVAAELAARNYRFDEAVALARQAVALDPANTRAYGDLGMHLMRTGDEAEARKALERSFSADPFDQVTYNLLALLDKLDKFVVETSGDLIVKFHPRRGAGAARVRDAAGARGAEDAVGEVQIHAEGADPDRDLPGPRRLRRAQPRAARA